MRVVRAASAAVAFVVVGYVVSLLPGVRPRPGFSPVWDGGVNVAALGGAAAVSAFRAVRMRADRAAWACVAVGLGTYATGTAIFWTFLHSREGVQHPSVADGFRLLFYPLALAAIGLMLSSRLSGSSVSIWLDGIVSGLGLASLAAVAVFPRVTATANGPPAAIVTHFAYPLLDLLLLAAAVAATVTLGVWRDSSWALASAGLIAFAVADSWHVLLAASDACHQGTSADASFPVAFPVAAALVAVAAGVSQHAGKRHAEGRGELAGTVGDGYGGRRPAHVDLSRRSQVRSFVVSGCFSLTALWTLGMAAATVMPPLGAGLAVAALLVALARTWLAVREVLRLADSHSQVLTDDLTGLPNRRAFCELVEAANAVNLRASGAGAPASVIVTDLNGFKEINDALGHQLGDELLREVSQRFAECVPPGGTIARLGGDEMALFVPGLSVRQAGEVCERLLDSLDEPFRLQGMMLHVGASVGITAVEPGSGAGRSLAKADRAMYRAKASRSGWEIYDEQQDGDAEDRLATVESLRTALADGQLSVDLQPVAVTATLRPYGMEALIRWNHPDRGMIPPDAFVPLAQKAGLMPAVTRTVLERSLDVASELRRSGWTLPVSVNLSASDLLDGTLVDHVTRALADRVLPGEALRIEITESLLVDSRSGATDLLHRLRALGVDLAVDDYGTGYSCLAYLHDLPVSHLKIDRAFTDRLLNDDRTALIVASTIDMAHGLGLTVVAEGVETGEQLAWLADHGCDLVQGYYISRPLGSEPLRSWLAQQRSGDHANPEVVTA
jgi:diguanylate cyclase (GGDEF)-like protein